MLIGIFMAGIILVFGSQIGIEYMNKNTVEKAIKDVLAKDKDGQSTKKIKEDIAQKISLNNIKLSEEDFIVKKTDKGYEVQVEYSKSIKVNNNISILMSFDISESSK